MEGQRIPKIWFTADTHFGHKNILKYCPERAKAGGFDIGDTAAHDEWLISQWNGKVAKKDIIYVIGDFAFGPPDNVKKLIQRLNGIKFLILGNHDRSSDKLTGYFRQITQLKDVVFKVSQFPYLDENLQIFMCHYPMVTWPEKHYGNVQLHGHCHGRLDEYNASSPDLRIDVGIDSAIAGFAPVELDIIHFAMRGKTGGVKFSEWASAMRDKNMIV